VLITDFDQRTDQDTGMIDWRKALALTVVVLLLPAYTWAKTVDLGTSLFERNCVVCHGIGGTGGRGPGLNRARLALAPDDSALRALIRNGHPPEMPGNQFFSEEDLDVVAGYVRSLGKTEVAEVRGDAVHGAQVFTNSGCPACHILAGKGAGYGPELTDLGDRRSARYVRQVILKPTAHLPEGFLMVGAVTADGQEIRGILVNEDNYTLQLKDVTGRFYSFRKTDLKEIEKLVGESPMPSFEGILSDVELDDVVAFLLSSQHPS
jgi:putative heme-binding domain-containing protein